jgi:dTDP-4-dehydrorhamnose reductase
MSRSVFITGGSGLLGVTWAIATRGTWSVTLGLHERDVRIRGVGCAHVRLDSEDDLLRAFESAKTALVVHTAGITNVETCEANPALAQRVNVEIATTVARAAARHGARLVHISTDHLFGVGDDLRVETDPVTPINVYGETKAAAERSVLDAHPEGLVVRTNFYGWGPPYRRSFSDVIIDGLRTGQPLTLFRDVWYSPMLMSALIDAVHGLVDREASGIFHVVGDQSMTKLEFGTRVARAFDLDTRHIVSCSISDKPELVQRPRHMGLSNQKATKMLGRPLGGVDEHLATLRREEDSAATTEIRSL